MLEVYKHLESRGYRVDYLDVDADGRIIPEQLEKAIKPDTALISVILVSNETGTIQDMGLISSIRDAVNPQASDTFRCRPGFRENEAFSREVRDRPHVLQFAQDTWSQGHRRIICIERGPG